MRRKCFKLRSVDPRMCRSLKTFDFSFIFLNTSRSKPLMDTSWGGSGRKRRRKGCPSLNLGLPDLLPCTSFTTAPCIRGVGWHIGSFAPSVQKAEDMPSFPSLLPTPPSLAELLPGVPTLTQGEFHIPWRMLRRVAQILGMWVWWGLKAFFTAQMQCAHLCKFLHSRQTGFSKHIRETRRKLPSISFASSAIHSSNVVVMEYPVASQERKHEKWGSFPTLRNSDLGSGI